MHVRPSNTSLSCGCTIPSAHIAWSKVVYSRRDFQTTHESSTFHSAQLMHLLTVPVIFTLGTLLLVGFQAFFEQTAVDRSSNRWILLHHLYNETQDSIQPGRNRSKEPPWAPLVWTRCILCALHSLRCLDRLFPTPGWRHLCHTRSKHKASSHLTVHQCSPSNDAPTILGFVLLVSFVDLLLFLWIGCVCVQLWCALCAFGSSPSFMYYKYFVQQAGLYQSLTSISLWHIKSSEAGPLGHAPYSAPGSHTHQIKIRFHPYIVEVVGM